MFVTMTAMMRVPAAACDYVRGKSRRGIRRGAASSWRTRHSRPRRTDDEGDAIAVRFDGLLDELKQ